MLNNSALPVSSAIRDVLTLTIEGIAEAGTWLTGAERVVVAEQAKARERELARALTRRQSVVRCSVPAALRRRSRL